jgi:hypothetical protein
MKSNSQSNAIVINEIGKKKSIEKRERERERESQLD